MYSFLCYSIVFFQRLGLDKNDECINKFRFEDYKELHKKLKINHKKITTGL